MSAFLTASQVVGFDAKSMKSVVPSIDGTVGGSASGAPVQMGEWDAILLVTIVTSGLS